MDRGPKKLPMGLSMMAMLAAQGHTPPYRFFGEEDKKSDKPEFTDAELAEIRSLPKAQRKKRVAELKAAHRNKVTAK